MGIDSELLVDPFPGPGLAIRILGDITPEKVRIFTRSRLYFYIFFKKKWII